VRELGGDAPGPDSADPIERQSSRLNFQGLVYPGRSGDMQPTDGPDHPPAFLCASYNDRLDIAEGLAEVYLRYKRAGASAEMHMYATKGHGFGLRPFETGSVAKWPERFLDWIVDVRPPSSAKL
jgi:acetyl esterase/lipase